jgi:hypothetical protein
MVMARTPELFETLCSEGHYKVVSEIPRTLVRWSRMKSLLFILAIATPSFAQVAFLGVKVTVPLGDVFTSNADSPFGLTSDSRLYLVGATAEVHLPLRFSVELDAIYKRTGFSTYFRSIGIGQSTDRVGSRVFSRFLNRLHKK